MAKDDLKKFVVGKPTSDTITVIHEPTGRLVEICVVAGSRAGDGLVARWSAGVIFDEAPRMNGEEDGIVNFDDSRRAVLGRLLPGAQLVAIGSPWAPRGPIFDGVRESWKKPTKDLVIIRAPATAMNPAWWTPKRVADLLRKDPHAHRTDVLGEFSDPETSLDSSVEIERATRKAPLHVPPSPHHEYVAACNPATRGNSWTLVIATRRFVDGKPKKSIVFHKQWTGSKAQPLSPFDTLKEIAAICRQYRVSVVESDQWSGDSLADLASLHGLAWVIRSISQSERNEMYTNFGRRLAANEVDLPPDPSVLADLQSVRRVVIQNGINIKLPRTADGRHADYAAAIALAMRCYFDEPTHNEEGEEIKPPALTLEEQNRAYERERLERRRSQVRGQSSSYWESTASRQRYQR